MKLEAAGIDIDIHQRFQEEVRNHPDLTCIHLIGTPMHIAVAQSLLEKHAPNVRFSSEGQPLHLLSLEAYGASVLRHLLEQTTIAEPVLLCSIPESMLRSYATAKGIPLHEEERDDVREFLDRITKIQPQTPFTLLRSTQRLKKVFSEDP